MRMSLTWMMLFLHLPFAHAMDFAFPFPPLRWNLQINKERLTYHSEGKNTNLTLTSCNTPLASAIVSEIFHHLPKKNEKKGPYLVIDKKNFYFRPGSRIHHYLDGLDARMIRLEIEEKKKCP